MLFFFAQLTYNGLVRLLTNTLAYIAWTISLVSTLGSLYFSQVQHLPPCILCWYQRILMYPLVIILAVGIMRRDKGTYQYVLPFSILGMLLSFYHVLLQRGIIPDQFAPCTAGVSCTTKYIEWLGFITIPVLSFVAFTVITICMIAYKRKAGHE